MPPIGLRYLAAEQAAFETVRREVTDALEPEDRVLANRYFAGSPMHADRFVQDWNRSFLLQPDGAPRGAVVFLHGLTDAPYSQRHIAERYQQLGFIAFGIRLPGHGTVPAGPDRDRLGGLAGGDAPGGAGSARARSGPACRCTSSAIPMAARWR